MQIAKEYHRGIMLLNCQDEQEDCACELWCFEYICVYRCRNCEKLVIMRPKIENKLRNYRQIVRTCT